MPLLLRPTRPLPAPLLRTAVLALLWLVADARAQEASTALPAPPSAAAAVVSVEATLDPATPTVFGYPGEPLWVRLELADERSSETGIGLRVPERLVSATIRGAGRVESTLWHVRVTPTPDAARGWLGDPGRWTIRLRDEVISGRSVAAADNFGGGASAWMLRVVVPAGLPTGATLLLEYGESIKPLHLLDRPAPTLNAARLFRPDAGFEAWGELGAMLVSWDSPNTRWRLELAGDRYGWRRLTSNLSDEPPWDASTRRPLDEFARQLEYHWRSALEALSAVDIELATDVAARLTAVCMMPWGSLAPVWSADTQADATLLLGLLDPRASDEAIIERATAWLEAQPDTSVWVIDDAGESLEREVTGLGAGWTVRGVTAVVAELAMRGGNATVGPEDPERRKLIGFKPMVAEGVRVPISAFPEDGGTLLVRRGDESIRTPVLAEPLAAQRPGLIVGPLLEPAAMSTTLAGMAALPPQRWRTALWLERGAGAGAPWRLLVEAGSPPGADRSGDIVTITIAPNPEALTPAQEQAAAQRPLLLIVGPAAEQRQDVQLRETGERWVAEVTLPWWVNSASAVSLSVMRRDGRGVLTAWPRPLLPGQPEPGRRWINVADWQTIDEELLDLMDR